MPRPNRTYPVIIRRKAGSGVRKIVQILQVAFTYIGTIVGAGFASGQEILQFFTKYGWMATYAIGVSTVLFILVGVKLMLMAADSGIQSFEDLNRKILGDKLGEAFNLFLLVVLLGTSAVMIAGAGSLFAEQLHLHYQTGLLVTVFCGYFVVSKGIQGLMAVNSLVVPVMLLFTCLVLYETWKLPTDSHWLTLTADYNPLRVWFSSLLYAAFNLATAQAVLVPLGAEIRDRKVLCWGGILGGAGIGLMLLVAHYALSAQMPGIRQFEIPMVRVIGGLGNTVQLIYMLVIFGEMFTTLVADAFGLSLQLQRRSGLGRRTINLGLLAVCCLFAQFGFSSLLSLLYPLFGLVSLIWLVFVFNRKLTCRPGSPQH
jgi:uncharacterized membrane protein YkvI